MTNHLPLTIEIVSDVVCPWCFIGLRRLDLALDMVRKEYPELTCVKHWRPFFLNPDTPPEGEPYLPFLIQKFGSQEKVNAIFQRVRDAGAAHGLEYHFEKISVRANTLNAHRLIHWAQQKGDAQRLVERLFVGQFQLGENVGDIAVLIRIAVECGHDYAEVEAYLTSNRDADLIQAMEQESRDWGISAVPTFIFSRKLGIQGAEDPIVLADAIRQVLQR